MAQGPEIRPFRDADADGVAAVYRALVPEELATGPLLLHWRKTAPERVRSTSWIAEEDGTVVGYGFARFLMGAADPGVARAWVGVLPAARRRGIGLELYTLAESHLREHRAHKIRSSIGDEPACRRFAERLGFRETRGDQFWTLDPREADLSELPSLGEEQEAEGFRVVTLGEVLQRPRDLHALYEEAELDVPGDDERREVPFEEWEQETLANPLLDRQGSVVVVQGERPVAFAWLLVDRANGRAEHELTGTVRDLRGRGLARLAKLAALRWCADNGVRTVLTANDDENAPMLAVNRRLGYRPTIVRAEIAKELAGPCTQE